jgi:hypothetical protein
MTNVTADTILARSEDVTYQLIAGEAILIRMSTGTYFSLNPVGTEFWNMLDGGQTIGRHAEMIADKYNAKVGALASELNGLAEVVLAELPGPAGAAARLRELAAGLPARYEVAEPPVAADLLEAAKGIESSPDAAPDGAAERIRRLADAVTRKYHVEGSRVLADLVALAGEMVSARLVHPL